MVPCAMMFGLSSQQTTDDVDTGDGFVHVETFLHYILALASCGLWWFCELELEDYFSSKLGCSFSKWSKKMSCPPVHLHFLTGHFRTKHAQSSKCFSHSM